MLSKFYNTDVVFLPHKLTHVVHLFIYSYTMKTWGAVTTLRVWPVYRKYPSLEDVVYPRLAWNTVGTLFELSRAVWYLPRQILPKESWARNLPFVLSMYIFNPCLQRMFEFFTQLSHFSIKYFIPPLPILKNQWHNN